MYRPIARVRGIDCVAWLLWLASVALFLAVTSTVEHKAGFATATVLVGMLGSMAWMAAMIRRAEERVSDQMTMEHQAQGSEGPTRLSQVR